MTTERIRATYEIACAEGAAERWAREIAVEQTVEIPEDCVPPEIEERVVGRVEGVEPTADGRCRAVVSYPVEIVGRGFGQLVNLLYGNVSMHRGIRLAAVGWPEELLTRLGGPTFGIDGLRAMAAVHDRPLVCAAIKPVGLSAEELARDAGRFALGGADFVKDDHSLDEQESLAPFRERAARCHEAVEEAAARRGGRCSYVPNLSGAPDELVDKVDWLSGLGVRAVMVNALIVGLPTVRWLADDARLAVFGHPTFSGAFLGADHGIAADVLYGDLFRIAGCDAVIFVNAGGRFAWTGERCDSIAAALRRPLGPLRPAVPVPAGGMQVDRAAAWVAHYGRDLMVLIGGSLYQQRDLTAATAELVRAVSDARAPG